MCSFHWMLRKSYMLILIRLFVGTWKNFGIWTWMVRHMVIHPCVHLTKKRWAFSSGNKDFVSEYFCVRYSSNRFSVSSHLNHLTASLSINFYFRGESSTRETIPYFSPLRCRLRKIQEGSCRRYTSWTISRLKCWSKQFIESYVNERVFTAYDITFYLRPAIFSQSMFFMFSFSKIINQLTKIYLITSNTKFRFSRSPKNGFGANHGARMKLRPKQKPSISVIIRFIKNLKFRWRRYVVSVTNLVI